MRRPDILVRLEDGHTYAIDVAVVDPAAKSHIMPRENSSLITAGGAALQEESKKKDKYRGTAYEDKLIPFVLEATGRLGPAAVEFLQKIGGKAAGRRGAFQVEVSVILARAMGRFATRTRSRLLAAGAL